MHKSLMFQAATVDTMKVHHLSNLSVFDSALQKTSQHMISSYVMSP